MNYLAATKKYYAEWLGVSPELLDQVGKFYVLYSPNRDTIQDGYSKPLDLYVYFSEETRIISYGHTLEQSIDWIQSSFEKTNDIAELRRIFFDRFGIFLQHDYKYCFSELPLGINYSKAKQLSLKDYPAYLQFFKFQYPDSEADSWLGNYYTRLVSKGYAFGIYVDGKLVCVSDSPDMPFMDDKAVEIGMNTLPAYQNQGYAKIVLGAMLKFLINIQKLPIVSCTSSNIASQHLIQSTGFLKLADVFTLSL